CRCRSSKRWCATSSVSRGGCGPKVRAASPSSRAACAARSTEPSGRRGWTPRGGSRTRSVMAPPAAVPAPDQLLRIEQERDLYLGLLDLSAETDREAFLSRALALVVGVVGAKQGYLELFSSDGNEASWYRATGLSGDEVERIRTLVSRGVIAHAVATG